MYWFIIIYHDFFQYDVVMDVVLRYFSVKLLERNWLAMYSMSFDMPEWRKRNIFVRSCIVFSWHYSEISFSKNWMKLLFVHTFGFDFPTGNIVDVPICIFEWFVTNGPLVRFAVDDDVTKLTAPPVVVSPFNVTSTFVWSTCKRLRSVTNSLLKLFKRCCKCTASLDDEASKNFAAKRREYLKRLNHWLEAKTQKNKYMVHSNKLLQ